MRAAEPVQHAPQLPARTVGEAGEAAVIELIRRRVPAPPDWVLAGIGDDAAVLEPARNALEVVTTDGLIEGVHFERASSSMADVGWKALAVNLSDLAAMGAEPRAALLSLGLPPGLPLDDLAALLDGLLELAAAARAPLVGGNVARSPGPLMVDVTVTGAVPRRRVLMRGGGRAGDELFVTGAIGAAAAGLAVLRDAPSRAGEPGLAACVARHRRPEPRLRAGRLFGRNRAASAAVDLSDGLADAVAQLARASGTGACLEAGAIPVEAAVRRWFEDAGRNAVEAALTGGEDYELLLAVPRRCRRRAEAVGRLLRGLPLTRIGELTAEETLLVRQGDRLVPLPAGFQHF